MEKNKNICNVVRTAYCELAKHNKELTLDVIRQGYFITIFDDKKYGNIVLIDTLKQLQFDDYKQYLRDSYKLYKEMYNSEHDKNKH